MPFSYAGFDTVISLNTIHNFPRPEVVIVLRELQWILKGKGFIQVESYHTLEQKELFEE